MIRYLPCNELALIESISVIKERFNLGDDDVLAELINLLLLFMLNVQNDLVNGRFFFL